ncbi:MAG: PilW family protein [Aeromonadaceae bacterium]|nr:PilW family protein [Aeromonadaceae bacterium]
MVAIAIGLFIIAGLYSMLSSSQQTYALSQANGQLTEAGRRVNRLLQNTLAQAGFINYQRLRLQNSLPVATVASPTVSWALGQSVEGSNDLTSTGTALAGTDVLLMRFYGSSIEDNDSNAPSITADDPDGFLFDCSGNAMNNQKLVTLSLYVSPTKQLICADDQGNTQVLASGIESLQFRFLPDTSGASFVTADNITNWSGVMAVEYAFLASAASGQGIQSASQSYQLLDKSVTAGGDRLLRQVFSGNITLHNQGG